MSTKNVNVEVQKTGSESSLSLLRRFSKRVQSSGVLTKKRSLRYKTRAQSPFKRKRSALERLNRRANRERLEKLGKAPIVKQRGRR